MQAKNYNTIMDLCTRAFVRLGQNANVSRVVNIHFQPFVIFHNKHIYKSNDTLVKVWDENRNVFARNSETSGCRLKRYAIGKTYTYICFTILCRNSTHTHMF